MGLLDNSFYDDPQRMAMMRMGLSLLGGAGPTTPPTGRGDAALEARRRKAAAEAEEQRFKEEERMRQEAAMRMHQAAAMRQPAMRGLPSSPIAYGQPQGLLGAGPQFSQWPQNQSRGRS